MYELKTTEIDQFALNGGLLVMEPLTAYGSCFVDPLTDFGFKRIFGSPFSERFMVSFLNCVFEEKEVIRNITYSPTELMGVPKGTKKVIFDSLCTGENGEQYILEMQRAYQGWFRDRMIYYNSRLINEQVPIGMQPLQYNIKGAYSVAVLDFTLPDSPEDEYFHTVCYSYRSSDKIFYTKQWYKFIELPKFNKTIDELETTFDKWLYILKHMGRMQDIPPVLNEGIFQYVFRIAEISNLTMEEHKMYRSSLQDQYDYENALAYATNEATKKGLEKGLREGLQKGLREGEERKTLAFVQSLVRDSDFDDQKIAALTGVEEKFVTSIRSKMPGE